MCKVRNIEDCQKKMIIHTINGQEYASDWFTDEERKGSLARNRFTTAEQTRYDALVEDNGIDEDYISHWAIQRNKCDADCIYISRHAFERMRERNGWNRKTALRMVQRVYDTGLSPEDVHGPYRTWVRSQAKKNPNVMLKFYGQMLYVFDNRILVTVIHGNIKKYA